MGVEERKLAMDIIGVVLGLMAALFWGTYLVPVKTMRIPEGQYTLAMGVGIGIVVIVVSPWLFILFQEPGDLLLSMLAGIIWSFGNISSLYAVRGLGFSRAVPIFSIAVLVNALFGILLFGELDSDPHRITILFIGMALLMGGIVVALSTHQKRKDIHASLIMMAILCGFLFGSYNAPIRATTVDPPTATAGVFLGMVITCTLLGLVMMEHDRRKGNKDTGRIVGRHFVTAMVSGVLWGVGTTFSVYAISRIGLALSFPIFQLNVLFYVIWGLFYFKEIDKRHYWKVLVGTMIIIVGASLVVAI